MRISDWSSDVCLRSQRSLAAASGLFVFLKGLDQRLILSKSCHAYKVSYPPFGVIVVRLLHQPVVSNESAKLLDQSGPSIWINPSRGLSGLAEVRRSEERRVGTECDSTVKSRWWTYY